MSSTDRRELNRRNFLIGTGVVGAAALVAGSAAITFDQLMSHASHDAAPAGERILVLVTMYGGNDGLNTVVPYADSAYHSARPDLSYKPEDVLHLDDQLGLNPAMKGLAGLWGEHKLAIVRGVGYPKPDRSHFRSMDIWQTASPDRPIATGWLGRWLDSTGDDPVRAVNIGSVLPPLAVGERATAAALIPNSVRNKTVDPTLVALSLADLSDTPAQAHVRQSLQACNLANTTFAGALAHDKSSGRALDAQLNLVATCIEAGVPTRCYTVSLGGFDTHANERGTQQDLLGRFDAAVTAFLARLAPHERGRNVVVAAYSEFGRRVKANASEGTDHGTSAPMLIVGQPVRGGFYGDQPSLTQLDNGDLAVTTDFRDVYHELLDRALGADPTPVVGPGRKDLGFLT